jgi:hypothetical protein
LSLFIDHRHRQDQKYILFVRPKCKGCISMFSCNAGGNIPVAASLFIEESPTWKEDGWILMR